MKEMWCDLVLNPDLPPPKAPPKLRLSFQWMLLAQKDAAGSAQDSQEKRLGTMTVWVLRAGDLYAGMRVVHVVGVICIVQVATARAC